VVAELKGRLLSTAPFPADHDKPPVAAGAIGGKCG